MRSCIASAGAPGHSGARSSEPAGQLFGDAERAIAGSLDAELGLDQQLGARLVAAALVAGVRVAEETAAARMQEQDRALTGPEVAALLDGAVLFAEAGIAAIRGRSSSTSASV